jgi:hypothetical protein
MAISFSERQLRTIRASLIFWRAVAEHSRVHPLAHPKVAEFVGDQPVLTEAEIEAMLGNVLMWEPGPVEPLGYPLSVVALTQVERARVVRELRRMGVAPLTCTGKAYTYRIEDLNRAKATLAERDEAAFRAKQRKLRRSMRTA